MPRWETGGCFMRFTIRDLLWLTGVFALVAVWRTDVARQEAVYRDKLAVYRDRLGERTANYYSPDRRFILHVAKSHPELLVELNAFDAANKKNLSEALSLVPLFDNVFDKAADFYRRDTGKAPYTFFVEEPATSP
jgi:hypothetical protein